MPIFNDSEHVPARLDRAGALALARGFVLELYPPAGDRSHPHTTAEIREMLSQILAIAEFLHGEQPPLDPSVLENILETVRSIDTHMP